MVLDVPGAGCPGAGCLMVLDVSGCWMSRVLDVWVLDVQMLDVPVLDVCESLIQCTTHKIREKNIKTCRQAKPKSNETKCFHCLKTFNEVSELKIHSVVHTGEKPNKCNQCDFAAGHKNFLKKHVKTIHEGRTYQCNICKKVYRNAHSIESYIKQWKKSF